ncbi:hypothetical protein ElyMa_005816900 [Elysia marginata]|uniref:Uncharacterized protein n=1 Tax=Elysia marginata TaxID=1093978 RepID=A0AAV4FUU0_9GAST|nr:hypothetical protein ElyMa_005816900 [Elysia marginata]
MSWRHRSCQVFTCCGLRLEASTPNRVWSRSSQSNLAKITCTTVKFFHTPTSELVEMACIQPLAPVYLQVCGPQRVWSRSSQSNLAKITCTTVKFFHTPTSELVEMTCIQPLAPVYLQVCGPHKI